MLDPTAVLRRPGTEVGTGAAHEGRPAADYREMRGDQGGDSKMLTPDHTARAQHRPGVADLEIASDAAAGPAASLRTGWTSAAGCGRDRRRSPPRHDPGSRSPPTRTGRLRRSWAAIRSGVRACRRTTHLDSPPALVQGCHPKPAKSPRARRQAGGSCTPISTPSPAVLTITRRISKTIRAMRSNLSRTDDGLAPHSRRLTIEARAGSAEVAPPRLSGPS